MPRTAFILILMADDTRGERLLDALRSRAGHSCRVVTSLVDALDSIRQRVPDVVVTDAVIDDRPVAPDLAALLDRLARDAALLTIGENPVPTRAKHVETLLLPEKEDVADLADAVSRAAEAAVNRRDDRLLSESIDEAQLPEFEGIIGQSPGIRKIIDRIERAAKHKLTVLILGETGTGKELIARAIHNRSGRAKKPFLPLNCAGLTESLLESQLFGHIKGAFTGATADRKGFFEAADSGTLFLDEIGDMPVTMQAKLLRTLDRREITPVGSTEIRHVDVRLIAATNVALKRHVDEGEFRTDLYYRLNEWVIKAPPLRERREDIPLLALHLLERARNTQGVDSTGISAEALSYLAKYSWPGNVRELANVVAQSAAEAHGRRVETDDLPEFIRGTRDLVPVTGGMVGLTMAEVERMMIERTLQATEGNREQTAKMLGIGTRTLYRKLKEFGIS